jgi:HEAT repeat protein
VDLRSAGRASKGLKDYFYYVGWYGDHSALFACHASPVHYFIAQSLGNLRDPRSVDSLVAVLEQCPPEAGLGRPDPTQPEVLFLHNDLTPCYRAAAAWALGRIGERRAAPTLLHVIEDERSATDTHYAAAEALERIADPASLTQISALARACREISTRRVLLRTIAKLTP